MSNHSNQPADAATADPRAGAEAEAATQAGDDDRAGGGETVDVATLQTELAQARAEAAAANDRFLRTRADMENYKRRLERTAADRLAGARKDLLRKLLAVRDNLERALQYGNASSGGEGIIEGVRLTQYQLDQLLEQEGVRPIKAEGEPFDPRLEEAIQSVNDLSVPDHTVVQVVRTGYTYQVGDGEAEVLRPAQVIVSVHPEGQ